MARKMTLKIIAIFTGLVGVIAATFWLTPVAVVGKYRMATLYGCYHDMSISMNGDVSGESVCPVNAPALRWEGSAKRRGNRLSIQVGPAVNNFRIEGSKLISPLDDDGPFIRITD